MVANPRKRNNAAKARTPAFVALLQFVSIQLFSSGSKVDGDARLPIKQLFMHDRTF